MAKFADVDIDMDEWEVLVPGDVASPLFSDELHFNPGDVIRMDHFTCPPELDTKHHVLEKEKNNSNEEEAAAAAEAPPPPPPHVVEFKDTTNIPELSIPHPVILPKLMDMESPKSLMKNNEEEEEEEEESAAEGKKHKAAAAAPACCDVNILGWRVSGGISALCSIGVAAATICMFILGGQQQRQQQQQQQQQRHQNQRHQFQLPTDDKRMEQLMQQATQLNQALSVVSGVPMTRAHISFGGYYDGL